jgi:hypothetical protein
LRQAFRERGPKVFYMDGLMLGPDWNCQRRSETRLIPPV